MRHVVLAAALSLVSLTSLAGCPRNAEPVAPSTLTPAEVVTAGKATIEKWRQAWELKSAETLGALYAHDLDLVVGIEGTAYLGWSQVETMLKERLAKASEIRIRLKDVSVVSLGPEHASAYATMTRETRALEGATTLTETGVVTLVLRKQGTDWVIAAEHYSYKRPT